ncbi:MAG: thioredoxin-dependent thiol peroxidase [Deltaproteobacteria bacterium]|jgi:peroxiredoxin Q/BCP|nr:thioredoxin-dependent thiol peroxidase [Deltaproteobacteria bacterium]
MGVLQAGQKAPEFCLANKDERNVRLEDYTGRWVVLYFYPKDNTSGCTREAVDFSDMVADFAQKQAVILGISPDSVKSHGKFMEKHGLKVELLSDPDHQVCERYGVWQLKKMCGRESFGVVRSTFLINPEGIIDKVWEKVKVDGHAAAVHDRLCALSSV